VKTALNERFSLVLTETTVEVNPRTVTREKLEKYLKMGINRLSVGVQSCVDSELTALGRNHTANQANETIKLAQNVGFRNISADIMLAIPNQTLESLEYSLQTLCELNITHISSYILKIEENTPFYGAGIEVDEDLSADMYLFMVDFLAKNGYEQYEISNFSKGGKFKSKHNLKYWKCMEYIGLGESAHSYFGGLRYFQKNSEKVITDKNPGTWEEQAMLGLRLTDGFEFPDNVIKKALILEKKGLINIKNNNISLTPKGFLICNKIISFLV
jgi:oxygen-independent coproporphyrinogen-3 oxidase